MYGEIDTPAAGWLDPEEDATWRAWMEMTDCVRTRVARDLQAESGLSEADYVVLVMLSEHPAHQIRLSDLATRLRWSKSRLSHQLARMEARGQIAKEGCPQDARGWYAVLTPSGLEDIRQAAPLHVASVRRNLIDALNRSQLAELHAISTVVIDHVAGLAAVVACPSADRGECGQG